MLFEDDKWIYVHQSIPPIRWIANIFGAIGSWAILKSAFAEENGREKIAAIYGYIYSQTLPLYTKYGSFYKLNKEIEDI